VREEEGKGEEKEGLQIYEEQEPMRRLFIPPLAAVFLAILAPSAQATPPALEPVSATNIQGVSATLAGTVDPEGLPTTYFFEYTTAASFSGAARTAVSPAGQGNAPRPVRAAISGLAPNTTYHYRLLATNSSGTTTGVAATFVTTAGFGFLSGTSGFSASVVKSGGEAATVPGSHPYQLSFNVGLRQGGEFEGQPGVAFPDGDLRDLRIEMPAGLIVNPGSLPKCTLSAFQTPRLSVFETSRSGESCPDNTQIGTAEVKSSLAGGQAIRFGLFNLTPPPGVPAQIGFAPFGAPVVLNENLRPNPDGSYVLTLEAANVPQLLDVSGLTLNLWGTPWGASHNDERGNCLNETEPTVPWCKASVGDPAAQIPKAYLTLPHQCSGPLSFAASAAAWQQPARVSANAINRTKAGVQASMSVCSGLAFSPKPVGQLTDVKASSPSGYNFTLAVDNTNFLDPDQLANPATKTMTLNLPNGVTINPSVGAGLGYCTPAQFAAETAFSVQGAACPNAAKLGDFTVRTPLFGEALEGAIYLAAPHDNPFGTLLSVYLVTRLPSRGLLIKLAGRIDPNPANGNLVATFDGLPQLPYEQLNLTFRTGQRAFLVTPAACGPATTVTDLVPWAGTGSVHAGSSTQVTSGVGFGPCPAGTPPYNPSVIAGGVNSNTNSYTPYFIHIARKDTEAELTRYSLVLPKGITGKLAGIPYCSDAAIEAAKSRDGFAEAAAPSCPQASQVGHTDSGYGVGNSLTYASGRIYLAGPYHGAPLSLVAINPATVGPFDLGTIVVRSAFAVDPHSAQLQIDSRASDPIPHILDGIPIHLRDLRIYMDRPQFTHNPSSCAPSDLSSTLGGSGADFGSGADDTTATSSVHFQLLNCRTLGFKPKLGVRLRGGSRRGSYPQLRATFAARGQGDTNLKEITVSLPHSEFLAQNHIKGICTKVQFNQGHCPADSAYGSAVAFTPLFDEPLRGNVYLRSSSGKLPDLVADLYSGAIHIVLEGRIGPTKQGGIQAYFADLPDEPLDRFVMTLNGGSRGLLQNSTNICANPPEATVKALGQTNLGAQFTTVLRGQCGKKGKKGAKKSSRERRHERGGKP
jgi:hypothetical protein